MSRRGSAQTPLPTPTEGSSETSDVDALAQPLVSRSERARRTWSRGSRFLLSARESLRTIPRSAWICALIACVNAVCWSLLTPPFQVPDEPSHFAYTQQLAENHRLPTSANASYSPEEQAVLQDVRHLEVRQSPEVHTISTAAEQEHLQETLDEHLSRHGEGGVGGSHSDPPLYYVLETVPYVLASPGTLLDQLEAMRLLSALMAGLTALLVFMFVRETLPGARWAWTVGGLSVALAPLLGFISGAVSPEAMLTTVSAAVFYALARAFRRGLTKRLAILIGVLLAVGFLTKLNFLGLAPGIVLGLIVLTVRASRTDGRAAYGRLGLALAIAVAPAWLYILVNLLSGHAGLGIVSTTLKLKGAHGSVLDKISYVWQLYLPRLPGMTNYLPGIATTRDLWFNRGVGYYGWLDTSFPVWVDNLVVLPAGILALLCVRSLVVGRGVLRRRIPEISVYATMALGLLTLIGLSSYIDASEGLFAEPRYLLPLLPILAAGLVLAARGAGRRWGPAVGATIVVLFLAHNVFSQLLVAARYYA
jgi:hypothetical protein